MATAEPFRQHQSSEHADSAFETLAEPFRREIKAHCYRMMGSLHEAEDLVQDTYLRAWRGFSSFEAKSEDGSMRAWLYRIATNACLNALEGRKHQQRYLPDQLGPSSPPRLEGGPALDIPWLEPYPDTNLEGIADLAPNPEVRYTSRESVQLAFVAAIQQFRPASAPRSCFAMSSAGPRLKQQLCSAVPPPRSIARSSALAKLFRSAILTAVLCPESQPSPAHQKLLGQYLRAWEGHDVDGFVALLKEDATVVMPPWLQWFVGREVIGSFFAAAWRTCGGLHLVPTSANGQPAFAIYEFSDAEKRWNAHSIHVLTLGENTISAVALFLDPRFFHNFGLPQILSDNASTGLLHLPHQ